MVVSATTPVAPWRRSSLGPTVGLAAVLLSLGVFISWGNLATSRAANVQADALMMAALFEQARYGVAVEELYARQYQIQPSSAVYRRYQDAVDVTVRTLTEVQQSRDPDARSRAEALMGLETAYLAAASKMISAVTSGDADVALIDGAEVAPAYFSLQAHADDTARDYRVAARCRVDALRRLQKQMLVGTVVGFAAGLALLAMIWRTVLGYQHKLARQVDANAHLALHDPLTGLPNRTLFTQRLAVETSTVSRSDVLPAACPSGPTGSGMNRTDPDAPGAGGPDTGQLTGLAVMIVDLDRFKEVNDTLGHHAGDQLLIEVGRRLVSVLGEQDVVARLGGDEFAILVPGIADAAAAERLAWAEAAVLRDPFLLEAGSGPVSALASIGVALWTGEGSLEELVQRADAAMYRAKSRHLSVAMFDAVLDTEDPARLALSGQLRMLLETGDPRQELVLHYQPQIRLEDAGVHGVEALVRWQHPTEGLLRPGDFLPIVEQAGLEIPLTYQLLAVAAAQGAAWAAAGHHVPVAVNVSPPCLLHPDFAAVVRRTLSEVGLPTAMLRIEVTEGSVMTDPDRSRTVLETLRDAGIGISIDDFGSGFSSLGQLRRTPVQELKIDQSFVRELARNDDDEMLVRTAVDLGHHHRTVVVAEGVEDTEALVALRRLGCDVAQGYLLSRPVPATELIDACARARGVVQAVLSTPPTPASTAFLDVPSPRATDSVEGFHDASHSRSMLP